MLDELIVPVASPVKTMADLKGKRVASGPGIQNVTLAKTVLERAGATGATVVELPIGQHVAALAAGQVDAAYTLEPTGTIGRLNGTTRVLEAGVIARYILGDPMAPWFGGSASLTSAFIKKHPEEAKKFIAAYGKGVNFVRTKPAEARQFLKGYTAIEGPLTSEVPLAAYTHVQRVHAGRHRVLPEVLRPVQRKGHLQLAPDGRHHALQGLNAMDAAPAASLAAASPGRRPPRTRPPRQRASPSWERCCRSSARSCCSSSGTWWCASASSRPILLPPPLDALGALVTGLWRRAAADRLRW